MKKKILIADDDDAIVDALEIMFNLEDFEVKSTKDGEAIYKIKEEYPDIVLLDIWMSGMDGRDICKYLKKNSETKQIPVIMISASKDVEKSAKDAGADDFVAKPFDIDDLLAKVKKLLK